MSYFKKYAKGETMEVSSTNKEKVKDVLEYPIFAIEERGITKETAEKFGIRTAVDPKDGKTPIAYYFPYYDQKGKLSGFKKRDMTLDKNDKYHFTAIGKVGVECKMFGQHVAETVQRKHSNIILVEGEWDVASAYQSLVDSVKNTKYTGMEPFVVGISCGTKNAVDSVMHNVEFVKSFDEVTFAFDSDSSTDEDKRKGIVRGKEAAEAVAAAILSNKQKLLKVEYTNDKKDPSDYLQSGDSRALAKLLSFDRKVFSVEKVIRSSEISFEELIEKRPEGIYIDCFPELMRKIHGLRGSEFIILTSPSGVGKSTTTAIFANTLLAANQKVGMIFLEETVKETKQRFVASKLKVNYLEFKNDPVKCAEDAGYDIEALRQAVSDVDAQDNLILLNHFGSMPIDDLMNKIKHMHFVEGCRFIFLDHLSLVISGSRVADERKELDIVCTELAAFCAANDCTVVAVSHMNRSGTDQFRPPKDKENEPYWVRVTKESLRGSAALEQLGFIVLGLEPEINPDRSRGRVRWVVLKNRPWSYLGEGDTFTIDENTWDVVLSGTEGF